MYDDVIRQYPQLTAEEERELFDKYPRDRWVELLVLHNIAYAIAFADNLNIINESREDCIGRALLGMTIAAKRFDPTRGFRFTTYATSYMMMSFRDVIDMKLNAARMNVSTMSVLDSPIKGRFKGQNDERKSIGDYLVNKTEFTGEPTNDIRDLAFGDEHESVVGQLTDFVRNEFPKKYKGNGNFAAYVFGMMLNGVPQEKICETTGRDKKTLRSVVVRCRELVAKGILDCGSDISDLKSVNELEAGAQRMLFRLGLRKASPKDRRLMFYDRHIGRFVKYNEELYREIFLLTEEKISEYDICRRLNIDNGFLKNAISINRNAMFGYDESSITLDKPYRCKTSSYRVMVGASYKKPKRMKSFFAKGSGGFYSDMTRKRIGHSKFNAPEMVVDDYGKVRYRW